MYDQLVLVSGEFIDCEGSGLFKLQSCRRWTQLQRSFVNDRLRLVVNHSCDANAEIQYLHNNSTLSVVATRTISKEEVG